VFLTRNPPWPSYQASLARAFPPGRPNPPSRRLPGTLQTPVSKSLVLLRAPLTRIQFVPFAVPCSAPPWPFFFFLLQKWFVFFRKLQPVHLIPRRPYIWLSPAHSTLCSPLSVKDSGPPPLGKLLGLPSWLLSRPISCAWHRVL